MGNHVSWLVEGFTLLLFIHQEHMIHTDTNYSQPTVFKLTTNLRDKYITLDTHGRVAKMMSITGKLGNTFMRVVSYVSNDAAVYEEVN